MPYGMRKDMSRKAVAALSTWIWSDSSFRLADTPKVYRELDEWIRHRLRAIQRKRWKRRRTVFRELVARGLNPDLAAQTAADTRRWWKKAAKGLNAALPNRWFDQLGLPRLGA